MVASETIAGIPARDKMIVLTTQWNGEKNGHKADAMARGVHITIRAPAEVRPGKFSTKMLRKING
jgi:hypothetical protein